MKNQIIIRKICTILLIFALFGIFVNSCSPKSSQGAGTDEKNTGEPLIIASPGFSEYKLVRPANADDDLLSKTVEIYTSVKSEIGASMEMGDDYLGQDESAGGRKEILIGFTNRPETASVMDSIGYFDYAIRQVGSKIVIAAHTKEALMTAVDVFCRELLVKTEQNGAQVLTFAGDRTWKSDRYVFFFSDNPIENYRIVYPDGNETLHIYANRIAEKLQKSFSITLPVVSDASEPSECEILLGVTSRAAYSSCYTGAEAPDSKHYLVRAAWSGILIVGTNERSAELACKRFLSDYLNDRYSNQFNLPDGLNRYEVAYESDPDAERGSAANLRVMSYNVLSKELTNTALDITLRKDLLTTTVLYYLPDVVGLQEVSETGWNMLEQELGDVYEMVGEKTPLGEFSYTGLMYNRNTVRLLEHENVLYSVGNRRIRLMSWGLFEHLETGRQFVVMSTHWDIVRENRQPDAEEMTVLVNALRAKYGCPVITTGDFNTLESTPYFKKYLTETGQTEARYEAAEIGFALNSDVIDHITSTSDLETLFFKLLQTPQTQEASDHNPIYADFRFR